jgi:ABC-type multidrug transport system ATPase subunit
LPPGQPRAALAAGIGMVHQHFTLADNLSVLDNVMLGTESLWQPFSRRAAARQRLVAEGARFGLQVDPDAARGRLSVGERQRVEILKALVRGARILILDEPTAVLTPQESESLFATLAQMVAQGLSIVFISHKLDEVLRVSHRIAVLRAGRLVATLPAAGCQQGAAGRGHGGPQRGTGAARGRRKPARRGVRTASGPGRRPPARRGPERARRRGAGRGRCLGQRPGHAGRGACAANARWTAARCRCRPGAAGAAACLCQRRRGARARRPPRRGRGGRPHAVGKRRARALPPAGFFTPRGGAAACRGGACDGLISRFDVRGTEDSGVHTTTRRLSGGNMQKLILGRVLGHGAGAPPLIVANQPTWGLDIGAVAYVHQQLLDAAAAGSAVL